MEAILNLHTLVNLFFAIVASIGLRLRWSVAVIAAIKPRSQEAPRPKHSLSRGRGSLTDYSFPKEQLTLASQMMHPSHP